MLTRSRSTCNEKLSFYNRAKVTKSSLEDAMYAFLAYDLNRVTRIQYEAHGLIVITSMQGIYEVHDEYEGDYEDLARFACLTQRALEYRKLPCSELVGKMRGGSEKSPRDLTIDECRAAAIWLCANVGRLMAVLDAFGFSRLTSSLKPYVNFTMLKEFIDTAVLAAECGLSFQKVSAELLSKPA